MFKSYLITAINNLSRDKLYSLINISGLAAGIAAFILIVLFVRHETSFDKHWPDAERIHLMTMDMSFPPGADPRRLTDFTSMFSPDALDQFLSEEISESLIISSFGQRIRLEDQTYEGGINYTEPSILDIFAFETLAGDLSATFQDTAGIALSEEEAIRLFGGTNVIGELVSVENENMGPRGGGSSIEVRDFQVTAVYRLAEGTTVLDLPSLALLEERPIPPTQGFFIRLVGERYFVKLNPGVTAEEVNGRLREFVDQSGSQFLRMQTQGGSPWDMAKLHLDPLDELYFDNLPPFNQVGSGNRDAVRIYSAVSALVLVIGCINFIILSTAKATKRAKEVAIRKVLGGKPPQLVGQFLGESLLLTFLGLVLAMLLISLLLPFFGNFLNLDLAMDYASVTTWLLMAGILFGVAFLGGLYPALVLSRFSPHRALRVNKADLADGSIRLRSVLVVFQFAISIALTVATLIVYAQLAFIKLDPGYNPENLMTVLARNGIMMQDNEVSYVGLANIETLKQELLGLPEVSAVGFTGSKPNETFPFTNEVTRPGAGTQAPVTVLMPVNNIGYDFFSTYQIPLVAGRMFEPERDLELSVQSAFGTPPGQQMPASKIIINEAAVRQLGFDSPESALGIPLNIGENRIAEVIGVIADNRFNDIWQVPRAEAYQLAPALSRYVTLRYSGDSDNIRRRVEAIWNTMAQDTEFQASFVQQDIDQAFTEEENLGRVFMLLSLLAVIISAMGLYGMASFTVDRRVKEIGIRKVMGARVKQIVSLLLWQFSKPVFVAAIVAWPVVLYVIQDWLSRFPFQIAFSSQALYCLLAGVIALVIASVTVTGNTLRVATSNPVEALRYE